MTGVERYIEGMCLFAYPNIGGHLMPLKVSFYTCLNY